MLPIEPILPQLREALRSGSAAVLVAPPGAGKTTRVPLALLGEPWLAGGRILMLEPRRLAARAAARYMAASLGEAVGGTVGYRVRMDTCVGPRTRVEVITEGVLTRLLQDDPALTGTGLVIFDEFHERSLHADLGLALCLQSRAILRADMRLLVMSATLDAAPVAALLGGAPTVVSAGRSYPVETRWLDRRPAGRLEDLVARSVRGALAGSAGDLLVFLPGAGEIRRVAAKLAEPDLGPGVEVAPLYGNLPQEAQDRAIAPSPAGGRKVVLATAVAETSLTVAGVRVVIDSGLMRVPRFSPRTGMSRLETVPVSRASADQRRGRAGRLGPGICLRLWTAAADRQLVARSTPEILEADLAPLALELAAWGVTDPADLSWLDPPPVGALAQARGLLGQLGGLDPGGTITPHGRRMAGLGLHPRLAHMVLAALPLGHGRLACDLAVLLGERDIFRSEAGLAPDADLRLRAEALRGAGGGARGGAGDGPRGNARGGAGDGPRGYAVDAAAVRRLRAEANELRRQLRLGPGGDYDADACGLLLAFAYPDRIAQRRPGGGFLLRSGRGAAFGGPQLLAEAPYLVAADLDDQGPESRIYLAAPVDPGDLEQHLGGEIADEALIVWDSAARAVRARRRRRLGALVLQEGPLPDPDPERIAAALLQGIAGEGLEILPWTQAARQLQQRLRFLHRRAPGWPDVSDAALAATLDGWLGPHLYGLKSRDDLQRLDLAGILTGMLSREQRRELETLAPTHVTVPTGSRIAIDYSDPAAPVLAVRLQELFGLAETPRIARGQVPLTLHLLSPAHRPVQVTQDLASFWRSAYFEVRKDLRGRYPKHYWPDDPLTAAPTKRARPRDQQ